ncbi:repeat and SOCS box 6 [Podarcis lilfordi]|uniref:Repeat and SOCS box 6 n=1 Tax=Podarcis lilfordi TaxID=74358 RepID=A0AA35PNZ6_9SAUR|nr:repeat and SOCS box 6 [Podarcis lilfordi]
MPFLHGFSRIYEYQGLVNEILEYMDPLALGSSDGVQIHNTESIRLFLEGGANVKATTKDGDTIFSSIISLLWKTVGGDEEEAQTVNPFCFQVTQLPMMTHGANPKDDTFSADLFQKAKTVLELLASSSQIIKLPSNFDINLSNCRFHRKRISDLFTSLKKLERSPPTLKHMCRVFLWKHLRPWPIDEKVKALPLPTLLKKYLLTDLSSSAEVAV